MTLFDRLRRLRDFLVEDKRRLYTHGQWLTADDLSAVLNLIEAAREVVEMDEHAGKRKPTRLEQAVAVFVSGQEEPKGKP